jgi:hypothetical protein
MVHQTEQAKTRMNPEFFRDLCGFSFFRVFHKSVLTPSYCYEFATALLPIYGIKVSYQNGSMSIVGVTQNGNTEWSGIKLLHFVLNDGICEEHDCEATKIT